MPKYVASQHVLQKAIAEARAAGIQTGPCGDGVWLGGKWDSTRSRWEWDDRVAFSSGHAPAVEAVGDTSPPVSYTNWAAGQPSAKERQDDEPLVYLDTSSGQWHDSHPNKYEFGIVCQEALPRPAGTLQLDGPFGHQQFEAVGGRPLSVEGLSGVGLAPGDILLVVEQPCGDNSSPVDRIGGEGFSFPSANGSSFEWPGAAVASGGLFTLCWCRRAPEITECRRSGDFLVPAGRLMLQAPSRSQRHMCWAGENCSVVLEWPQTVEPKVLGSLQVVGGEGSCDGPLTMGFPDAKSSEEEFQWPLVSANAGIYGLCWCPDLVCKNRDDEHGHLIGVLEVRGPFSSHTFACQPARVEEGGQLQPCHVRPLLGRGLQDGSSLIVTSRSRCPGVDDDDSVGSLSLELKSLPAEHCNDYFVGCTYTWPAGALIAAPAGIYLLCWCGLLLEHGCTVATQFVVGVGTLELLPSSNDR